MSAALIIGTMFGCKPSFTISDKNYQEHNIEVATADNGYSIGMPEVYEELSKSKLLNLGGILEPEQTQEFIDSLVLDSMIGFEANEIKLVEHYEQFRMFKLRYYDILIRAYLKKMVYDKAIFDSLDVVEYYYANEELFKIEEQVNLYHLSLTKETLLNGDDSLKFRKYSSEDLETALIKYADSVKSLIISPELFPEIAKQFSEDVTKIQDGGYIGWTKRNKFHPPFDSVAFSLQVGEISEPYKDINGWHIIMIDEYFAEGLPELTKQLFVSVEKNLKNIKTNRIGNQLIDSLMSTLHIQVNKEIADKNMFIVDGQTWGATVNGLDTIDCNEARSLELNYRDKFKVLNTTPEMKEQLFKQIGEKYIIVQAARNVGLESDSAITEQREKLIHKYARNIITKERADFRWTPNDSLIEAYYNNNLIDFEVNKPLKVQHIIVADSLFGEFLRDQAMSGVDFMELANEHYPGEESIRNDLADLGYIGKTDVSESFFHAASITLVGDVSHPVKTEFGYHLIKVLDIKKSQTVKEARRIIIPILKKEYQTTHLQNFKNKLFVKYNVQSKAQLYPIHLRPKSLRK